MIRGVIIWFRKRVLKQELYSVEMILEKVKECIRNDEEILKISIEETKRAKARRQRFALLLNNGNYVSERRENVLEHFKGDKEK